MLLPIATSLCALASIATAQTAASYAYTPDVAPCPLGTELVRLAGTAGNQTLNANEQAYIETRLSDVLPAAFQSYLMNVEGTNVNLPPYVSDILTGNGENLPIIGLAASGGGERASIFAAGVFNAFDGRNESSQCSGLGGLLQASSYMSSLSGGNFFVSSLALANFPTIQDLIFGPPDGLTNDSTWGGWSAQIDLIEPFNDTTDNEEFLIEIVTELAGKYEAGFPITLNDMWARLMARHFVNGTNTENFFNFTDPHGAGILYSDITELQSFQSHSMPFPIVVATSESTGGNMSNILEGDFVPLTNPKYEFSAYEFGSWDPSLSAFIPIKLLGSTNDSVCVTNFEQASLIIAMSSFIFPELNTSAAALAESEIAPLLYLLNSSLPQPPSIELDIAIVPNAFQGISPSTFIDTNQSNILLLDGGEDGVVLPLSSLLVEAREIDIILAIDATNDINDFAAGSSLIAQSKRSKLIPGTAFPPVPQTIMEFTQRNLSTQPTFFGCDNAAPTPLIVYIANGGPPMGQQPLTNTSTSQTTYQPDQIQAMLNQIDIIAKQGRPANSSELTDPEWAGCLACAVVDRKRAAMGTARTGVCSDCFGRYCAESILAPTPM